MFQTHHTTKKYYTHLSETERTKIEILLQESYSQTDIAKRLNRSKSTISREIKRGSIIQRKNVNSCDIIEVKKIFCRCHSNFSV